MQPELRLLDTSIDLDLDSLGTRLPLLYIIVLVELGWQVRMVYVRRRSIQQYDYLRGPLVFCSCTRTSGYVRMGRTGYWRTQGRDIFT